MTFQEKIGIIKKLPSSDFLTFSALRNMQAGKNIEGLTGLVSFLARDYQFMCYADKRKEEIRLSINLDISCKESQKALLTAYLIMINLVSPYDYLFKFDARKPTVYIITDIPCDEKIIISDLEVSFYNLLDIMKDFYDVIEAISNGLIPKRKGDEASELFYNIFDSESVIRPPTKRISLSNDILPIGRKYGSCYKNNNSGSTEDFLSSLKDEPPQSQDDDYFNSLLNLDGD